MYDTHMDGLSVTPHLACSRIALTILRCSQIIPQRFEIIHEHESRLVGIDWHVFRGRVCWIHLCAAAYYALDVFARYGVRETFVQDLESLLQSFRK